MSDTTDGELEAFETKNERMAVGALGGYVVGGPVGAIAGAYIGRKWD